MQEVITGHTILFTFIIQSDQGGYQVIGEGSYLAGFESTCWPIQVRDELITRNQAVRAIYFDRGFKTLETGEKRAGVVGCLRGKCSIMVW